jgi:cytochrome oxidase Cu insertion factor (SCO1/SenC/PrrC family)
MRAIACRLIAAIALVATTSAAGGQSDRAVPPDEDRFLNAPLPNVDLITAGGAHTDVAGVADGRPLLLALVFTRCAGVCSPFLASWRDADQWLSSRSGITHLVISFDPRDSAADMAEFAQHFGLEHDPAWTFAVAAPGDIRRIAEAVGFWYDWDESRQQFDHPAMLAAARDGRVVRLLVGSTVSSALLDELTREASGEFIGSYPLPSRSTFRCVQYDPRTGRLKLDWGFALLLVPVGVMGVTTAVMFLAGGRVRRTTPSRGRGQ